MKITSFFKVLILLLMTSGTLHAQNVIYSENFNDDIEKGNNGGDVDLSGVDWTLNTNNCTIEAGDYMKVVDTGNDRLEAFDSDGEAVWMSPIIDISSYSDIDISVYTAETGGGTNADNKYIKLYYILDEGSEVLFFESTVNWTSSTATITSLNGINLKIVARIKTTYTSDKIYIDDILVSGTPKSTTNDELTQILSPTNQISSQNISSVINDQISAQTLLKFKLSESASSDNLDTKIASLKFKNIALTKQVDLSTQFEGFSIYDGTNFIPISSINISTDLVTLNFAEGDYSLLDNSSQEYELRGYLKTNGIGDGQIVQLVLEGGASDITTYTSGSSFDAANSIAVSSPEHQISVIATQLNFTSIPTSSLVKNTNFSVSVSASDSNENVDIDASQDVDLSMHTGTGLLAGVLSKPLLNGELVFADLTYNIAEDITIETSGLGLESAISNPISIISTLSTTLSLPSWTPTSLNISSISNTPENAVEVYRFSIDDIGDDMESTFLNNIRLVPGDNNNVIWEDVLAGFILQVGEDILETTYVLSNSAIDITIPSSELLREIIDGDSKIFSIFFYLKTKLIDDEILQINVDNSHSAWLTSGSGLVPNFAGDLNGPEFKVDVIGSHLNFTSIPAMDVEFASNFPVSVSLTDMNNNIDLNANQTISLALLEGKGNLSGTLTENLNFGVTSFDDLSYNYSESINLILSGMGLVSDESELIHILPSNSSNSYVPDWISEDLHISSLFVYENNFKEVFRSQVVDNGDDQVSSVLKNIRLIAGNVNTMDWQADIGNFQLKINNQIVDVEFLPSKSDLSISFADDENLAIIADGQSAVLSLNLFLDEKSTEGEVFQAAIENIHSQWEIIGTQLLNEFPDNLEDKSFVVDVEGTELSFIKKPPKSLVPNTNFEMELKLIDKFGNQDLNSTKEARVSLASGTGNLTSAKGLNVSLVNGMFSWTDLSYDKAENFTLLIEVEELDPVLSDNISSLDANSSLISSEIPVSFQVLNPLSIDIENSEEVLDFVVKDLARLDEISTLITTMKFYNTIIDSGLDWKKHVAGAVIKRDGELLAKTDKVDEDKITFSSLDIEITNGSQSEFELSIYFKKSLIPDHAKFQVEIRKDHEWKTSSTGSSLINELSEGILSPMHEIDVNADRLSFISYPKGIEELENFRLRIAAVDEYQNIDIDKSSSISLSLKSGVLSQTGVIGNLDDGILEVSDLSFTGDQILELTACSDLQSVAKEIFVQAANVIFSDDFESDNLSLWENTDAWTTSSYNSINGNFSLKHNLTNAIGSSCVICPLNNIEVGEESIFWEFILRNSDWDPTSSNNFVFHLLMDSNDSELAENLYSVGVNLSGSDDRLSLWKTEDEDSQLLLKSDFDWNKEETVAVKVEYNTKGEWILSYNRLGEKNNYLETGTVISEVKTSIDNWYSGLEFNFETASRAGELWFDDLIIETYNTAPYLRNYEVLADSIALNFSEDLNILESSKLENFKLYLGEVPILIKEVKFTDLDNQLVLVFVNALITGNYNLKVRFIEDLKGAIANEETIRFDFYEEVMEHDLVINEIFVDESPVIGLPEYEFIEIYNTSDYPIKLEGFKLKVGNTEKILTNYGMASHEYLIMCSNAAVEFYNKHGNALGVSSFPSLTNSGTNISLESPAGILMDEIAYSKDWYGDEDKEDGGWSIERIDMTNYCSTLSNWKASLNKIGGTPGMTNSIKGIYQDTQSPELVSYKLISNQTLLIEFSQMVNEDSALSLLNYTIEENAVSSIIKKSDKIYSLHFVSLFQDGVDQKLFMNKLADECGNSKQLQVSFVWREIHEYNLVINEIFADESPIVGLPEYEFVEIYNTSDYPIKLDDFKLKVGSTEKTLSDYELASHEYLILCSNAASEYYKEFGNVLGLSSFSSLTNSGTNISLESPASILMDEITYSSDWYANDSKKDGGWSLERIDMNNHSWQADNWRASMDTKGGTPGQVNSVVADNPDNTAPSLLYFEIDEPNSIRLYFSETLRLPQAYLVENYSIDNGINNPNSIQVIDDEKFALSLSFASDFESNVHYQFSLSDQLSDLEGNLFVEREFKFLLADLPKEGDLVINEVLFNPYPNGADYVELLNVSDRIIDIKDLLIANRDENYQLDEVYPLSNQSRILEADSYLLLSTDTVNIKLNYSYLDESAFVQLTKMPSYNDDEGRVVIMNKNNEQIDDFAYDESMHFSQLTSDEGVSLERINPNKETNSSSNWISASQTANFGTPGMQNSSYDIGEVEVNEIGFKSKIFSPDNDGVDDRLVINFKLEKSGYVANIRVYNSLGREVRRLASNMTLSTKDELFWDGLLVNKERAPIGIYVFYFELFHPDGEVKTYKKTCVIGGKFK